MRWLMVAFAAATPSVAYAHITLTYPPPRTTMQKAGPCGVANSVRGTNVTTLAPGSTITVTWNETIQHPGHYRISFDTDGQDFSVPPNTTADTSATDPNVLADLIADTATTAYSKQITLPNVSCTSCTLQVIQLMTDKPPYTTDAASDDIYYQCADITLMPGAPDAGVPADASVPGGADAGTGSGSDEPDGGVGGALVNPYASRGCSSAPMSSLGSLLVLGWLCRRRRARCGRLSCAQATRVAGLNGQRASSR